MVSDEKISARGKRIVVLFSGIEVDPFTNEFFEGKKGHNPDWNITTLTLTYDLDWIAIMLMCNQGGNTITMELRMRISINWAWTEGI